MMNRTARHSLHTVDRRPSTAHHPRGFTFVEVLFAIIILGIGMIMIAGILPVAIKQQSDTRDELTAKALCESGYAYLRAVIQSNPNAFPRTNDNTGGIAGPNALTNTATGLLGSKKLNTDPTRYAGKLVPLNEQVTTFGRPGGRFEIVDAITGSRVSSSNPRFQYLAFYRRDENASFIRLVVVAMKLQNVGVREFYGYDKGADTNTLWKEELNANNGPFLFDVVINNQTLEPDRIVFQAGSSPEQVLAEGAFVVIANSEPRGTGANNDIQRPYRNNGRVFRLGQQRLDIDPNGRTWDLATPYDLAIAAVGPDGLENTADDVVDGSMNPSGNYPVGNGVDGGTIAQAWVIGRGVLDPSSNANTGSNPYSGPAQDIGVLVADVPLP